MGLWDENNWGWGERIDDALGGVESTLEGIREKNFTKVKAHAGMAKRLVIDLAIKEALREEIKYTLEQNNHSYGYWCALPDKEKTTTRLNLP